MLLVIVVGLAALLAPWVAPYDPFEVQPVARLQPPSKVHPFGTDELGRDLLSRILLGARISLYAALVIISLSLLVGTALGTIGGFIGSWIDDILMRLTDSFLAFPYLIFAMLISASLGPGLRNAMIAISVTWWPWYARLARAQILAVKNELYMEAARATGIGGLRLF
jgi:peptide/nickel transport system permease protein